MLPWRGAGGMLAPTCGDLGTVTSTHFQQQPLQPLVHPGAPQTLLSALRGDKRWALSFAPCCFDPTCCLNRTRRVRGSLQLSINSLKANTIVAGATSEPNEAGATDAATVSYLSHQPRGAK